MISGYIHDGCSKTDLFYPHVVQVFRISLTFWQNHISVWQTLIVLDSIIHSYQRLLFAFSAVLVRRCIGRDTFGCAMVLCWLCPELEFPQTVLTLPAAVALVSNEFWDYEEQVDLEAFSSSTFYDILLKHSVSVTIRLGHLRGEVRLIDCEQVYFLPLWASNITPVKFKHIYPYWTASLRCLVVIYSLSCFTVHYDTYCVGYSSELLLPWGEVCGLTCKMSCKYSVPLLTCFVDGNVQVKQLYQGVLGKLRELHPGRRMFGGKTEGLERQVEQEMVRRRALGNQLTQLLDSQLQILRLEMRAQQAMQKTFRARLRESVRLLRLLAEGQTSLWNKHIKQQYGEADMYLFYLCLLIHVYVCVRNLVTHLKKILNHKKVVHNYINAVNIIKLIILYLE